VSNISARAVSTRMLLVLAVAGSALAQAPQRQLAVPTNLPLGPWHALDSAKQSCTQRNGRYLVNCPVPAETFSAMRVSRGVRLIMKVNDSCGWQWRAQYRLSVDTLHVWLWPIDYRVDVSCPGVAWYHVWEATVPRVSSRVRFAALRIRWTALPVDPATTPDAPSETVEIGQLPPIARH
jgi:hypothetical protein